MPSRTIAQIHANAYSAPAPRTAAAQAAPRCEHIKYNNEQCGCPALRGQTLCRFHVHADQTWSDGIPLIEDAASVQLAILRILRALDFGSLDYKKASLMLYGLQIASMNLKRLETAFAVPAAQAGDAREYSLAADLFQRLDDHEFLRKLSAAGRERPLAPPVPPSDPRP